ncbi:sulfurtransferase complex subunit TusC [Marinobacterium jannaschii]|uniref:sulfurtransferase complex subunit TusC n=1 Tax=Marinobacterium jannaschii TaxID=64970 RepID=UPI00047F75C2|nr:sulfurtransferase complex subunit TusC [Marinobacterium jannaschii]
MSKSVLIVNRKAPYGSSAPREALDVALTCGVFEQPVSLLFLGDAVFQLLKAQQPDAIGQKNLASNLSALPMYDIDQLFVCAESLANNGLDPDDLILPVTLLEKDSVAPLFANHDVVLTF